MTAGNFKALEANLARTAVEVVIPPEHAALLDITERWHGVHEATAELLREAHHRYAGWAQTLADLRRRSTGDFHYHDAHPRGAEAIGIVCDLYAKLVREATPDDVRHDAVRYWLTYLDYVVRESRGTLARNLPVLGESLATLAGFLRNSPDLERVASTGLRRLCSTLVGVPDDAAADVSEAALALLRDTLLGVLTAWLEQPDPARWLDEIGVLPPDDAHVVSHAELRSAVGVLRDLTPPLRDRAATILGVPDSTQIMRSYVDVAEALGTGPDKLAARKAQIRWLLRVLGHEGLAPVHETALRNIAQAFSGLISDEAADHRGLLREIFHLLRTQEFPYPGTVLNLISRIGTHALAVGDPELADALVDEVLGTDFEYPSFAGFTDEWSLRANPAHVEALRTWLGLIATDPLAARPLLVALVAHVRLGGVSIPDSALFQRNVSALLAAPVETVYVQVTHLLRLLPVYFAEIGSEGLLREVSTRIDEALQRRDQLCHFLRKQSHVECNPHLIDFIEEIGRYWATGEREPLRAYVPPSLFDGLDATDPATRGIHDVFAGLVERVGSVREVLASDAETVRDLIAEVDAGDPTDRERAELLVRLSHEIRRKYALDHEDAVERLRAHRRVSATTIDRLAGALGREDHAAALDATLAALEELQAIILSPGETHAVEDIYFKRHIAVGIPSMYGSYREERLDAVGLSFRLESLASSLCERIMDVDSLPPDRTSRLRVVAGWLRALQRGLRIEGFHAQGLANTLGMLDEALSRPATTEAQLLTVFQMLSRNLDVMIRARILDVYEEPVRRVVARMIERGVLDALGGSAEAAMLRHSEALLRDVIAESFALQRIDSLVAHCIRELADRVDAGMRAPATAAPTARADRHGVFPVAEAPPELGIVALGGKAFMLRQLTRMGLRVPDGFVLTTDVFADGGRLSGDGAARNALEPRVREALARLEESTALRLGDPARPLLLSVRGGAPLSMPGMLATFLNVGMNPRVAEGFAIARGDWTAWDAYRRFVQSWGMAHGIDRDVFDEIIAATKRRRGVERKVHLPAGAMRELAFDYRRLVEAAGIEVEDDPFAQLLACIDLVQASWDAAGARLYRRELHISDEWGTAATVQAMVFGNLDERSGTGVVLTDNPERAAEAVSLTGDFTIKSQGDDIVGGLVETYPITERQRRRESREVDVSLEKDFPAIYGALADVARHLVQDHGLNHQEIEFTFESDRAEDLYLLQTRDTVVTSAGQVPAFLPSQSLERATIAHGIGASGGALSGRVACTMAQIEEVRRRHPDDPVILLRPDTVPEDIALVLASDGLLTALGGATSHAAVAAKRLGKTCVVGCRALDVDQRTGTARIGSRVLRTGTKLSISGIDGTVFLGAHPVTMVGVEGRN